MTGPYTASAREILLREYFELRETLADLGVSLQEAEGEDESRLRQQLALALERMSALSDRYLDGMPVLPLSRCPFTGTVVTHSIDNAGIDGLWWDYYAPLRPAERLPTTMFALGGALKLGETVEDFPFTCGPGPELPYVVPRLLERPDIKAVVSAVEVGPHRAYPIFYFVDPMPNDIRRINTWGTGEYALVDDNGLFLWDAVEDSAEDFDFDLERWIRRGKLLWIWPGDQTMALHSDVRRCPYLDLSGRRFPLHISMGRVLNTEPAWLAV